MKNLLLLFLFFIKISLNGQSFGNEWYNSGDQFLKFTINQNGIYRVNKTDLTNAGLIIDNKLLKYYRLFYKGQEMKIVVSGNPEAQMGDSDYLEFYAEKNTGWQDIEVYRDPTKRANPYYSLYTDETSYFLSINGTVLGQRIINNPIVNNSFASENYFLNIIIKNFSNDWIYDALKCFPPPAVESKFENYEGVCSPIYFKRFSVDGTVLGENPLIENVNLINYNNTVGVNISFESQLTTRNQFSSNLNYNIGGNSGTINSQTFFNIANLNSSISTLPSASLSLNINSTGAVNNDFWSIYFYKIKYPSSPIYLEKSFYEFKNNGTTENLRIQLTSSPSVVYGYSVEDIFNQKKIQININAGVADIYFSNNSNSNKIFLSSTLQKPKAYKLITFNKPSPANFDFLMVSETRLMTSSQAYKTYRESSLGGAYLVKLENVWDLYDQYSYGEKNPIAIRRFVDFMTRNANSIKYLLIIGKSVSEPARLKLREIANQPLNDYVPTFGYPASDVLFSSGLLGFSPSIPSIPTGRISAKTDQEVTNYLNKVKEHESATNKLNRTWQKNMLHLAGPKSQSEYVSLFNASESFRAIANNSIFAANPTSFLTINKPLSTWNGTEYGSTVVPQAFYDNVNNGVGIINYFGHGAPTSIVHNFGYVSKQAPLGVGGPLYFNQGKYPFLIANGCGIANGFRDQDDIASDWINTANKGAINTLSQTYLSYEAYDERTMVALYNILFGPASSPSSRPNANMINDAIGKVIQSASVQNIATPNTNGSIPGSDPAGPNPDPFFIANLQQTMLLGDPSVAIFNSPTTQPLSLDLTNITLLAENNEVKIDWNTSNEVLVDGFEIERSNDGKKFEKIGYVKAFNNEKNIYSFIDNEPIYGISYYRLKLLDLDKTFHYSPIKSMNINNSNFSIFNNPIIENYIDISINNIDLSTLKIFTTNGQNVPYNLLKKDNGNFRIVPKTEFNAGEFIVNVNDSSRVRTISKKIIIKK